MSKLSVFSVQKKKKTVNKAELINKKRAIGFPKALFYWVIYWVIYWVSVTQ